MTYVVSGYFINGFTSGHKEMLSAIKERMTEEDKIIVIVNNEKQQELKYVSAKRKLWEIDELIVPFLTNTFGSRFFIQRSIDIDRTVRLTLEYIRNWYLGDSFCFVNDGDVLNKCPEEEVQGYDFLYLGHPSSYRLWKASTY